MLNVPVWPRIEAEDEEAILQVVRSGRLWSKEGTKVDELEQRFAEKHGCRYGVAMTNGTHALVATLRALGVRPGDEVVLPDFTFISTASAVLEVGALPILVDVDPSTYNLRPESLRSLITPRTRAIVPVHMSGVLCEMQQLADALRGTDVVIIEDAAHAHGARARGEGFCQRSVAAFFSFQQYKLMTAGEGGMVVTNDADLAKRLSLVANVGRPFPDPRYDYQLLGSNFRMTELQAALLLGQLGRLDSLAEARMKNAALFRTLVSSIDQIRLQGWNDNQSIHPYYMLMLTCPNRDEAVTRLRAQGLPASRAFAPLHRSEVIVGPQAQQGHSRPTDADFPVSSALGDNALWLHHRVLLGDETFTRALASAVIEACSGR